MDCDLHGPDSNDQAQGRPTRSLNLTTSVCVAYTHGQ